MEGITGLCLGFFFGILFSESIDYIKRKIKDKYNI